MPGAFVPRPLKKCYPSLVKELLCEGCPLAIPFCKGSPLFQRCICVHTYKHFCKGDFLFYKSAPLLQGFWNSWTWVFILIWTSPLASSLASGMVGTASFKRSLVVLTFPLSPFASCFFTLPSVVSSFESCASFSLKAGFVRYCMPFTFSSASS